MVDTESELDAHAADELGFAQALGRAQLVFGYAVGIQAAGQRPPLHDGDRGPMPPQFRGARQRSRAAADAGHPQIARVRRSRQQHLLQKL